MVGAGCWLKVGDSFGPTSISAACVLLLFKRLLINADEQQKDAIVARAA